MYVCIYVYQGSNFVVVLLEQIFQLFIHQFTSHTTTFKTNFSVGN